MEEKEIYSKAISTFQKKVNHQQNRIHKLVISVEEKNVAIRLLNAFITKLLNDGRITREEMREAIKNRNYSKQVVRENHLKYKSKQH